MFLKIFRRFGSQKFSGFQFLTELALPSVHIFAVLFGEAQDLSKSVLWIFVVHSVRVCVCQCVCQCLCVVPCVSTGVSECMFCTLSKVDMS